MQDLVTFSLFNQSGHKRCRHRLGMGWIEYPSVPHRPPQFNTSVPLLDHTFSAPKIPQFHTKNPSVPHQKPLSSTPKTPQFHTKKLYISELYSFFSLRQRMLYEMAESLINSIVGGPDYEHADVQEKIVLQRGNEIQRELSEFEFERKRADSSKEI